MTKKKNKKVAILGKLPTKFKAPFGDDTWDIWTLNIHPDENQLPRISLWFDIHSHGINPKANITRANYPFKEAEELVGGQYYNNSISYMIAYAILHKYKEIALYGMAFLNDNEHRREEFLNVRELIMFARGKGLKIIAPVDPIMLKEYEYYGL